MADGSRIILRVAAEADVPAPDTGQVALFMDSDASDMPAVKDHAGTVSSLAGAPGAPGADAPPLTYLDHGNTGASENIDASAADVHRLVANVASVAITFSGWPVSGTPAVVRGWLEQDGVGGRIWTWPAAVDWGDAGEPDWTTRTAGEVDLIDFMTVDAGTKIIAVVAGRAGPAGANGTNGTNGTNGVDGKTGGAIAIPYTFSTTTTDADPGNGNLRLDNATQSSATTIRADLLASDATDWTAVLDTLADASNAVKGHVRLFKTADPTKWIVATVSAIASPSGYRNITIAVVGSSSSSPFGNGDAITLAFSRAGDQGSTVGSGTVTTVEEVDGSPTDSAVTKIVFPNGTLAIVSHVATYTPSSAGATPAESAGARIYAYLNFR